MSALLRAFRMLFEVILLTGFCLMVFAIFGLQVYKGVLRQKCIVDAVGQLNDSMEHISKDEFDYTWKKHEGRCKKIKYRRYSSILRNHL